MIDYNTFLGQVQIPHMQILASFTAGERVRILDTDTVGIDAARAAAQQLFDSGLLSRVAEGYEMVEDVKWRTFDGYVVLAALGYCWQLARERLALSREPLPPA
jgi:hypothetical protein